MPIHFEIDVKKLGGVFSPTRLDEVVEAAGRALGTQFAPDELKLIGTDHVTKKRLESDKDLAEFLKAKGVTGEKVLKFAIPDRVIGTEFRPKKTKILCTGSRVSKFFGEEQVSTRDVEFSLKLFDCGHFYLKQALPGSGASPYWVIFEGKWVRHEKSLRLLCCLRYAWQIKACKDMDEDAFAIEATPPGLEGRLAYVGDSEAQLNGQFPAIVGKEPYCWAELCREPDKAMVSKTRFNEEEAKFAASNTPATYRPNIGFDSSRTRNGRSSSEDTGRLDACPSRTSLLEGQISSRQGVMHRRDQGVWRQEHYSFESDGTTLPFYFGLSVLAFLILLVTYHSYHLEDDYRTIEESEGFDL